jgi:hypothetical protein
MQLEKAPAPIVPTALPLLKSYPEKVNVLNEAQPEKAWFPMVPTALYITVMDHACSQIHSHLFEAFVPVEG